MVRLMFAIRRGSGQHERKEAYSRVVSDVFCFRMAAIAFVSAGPNLPESTLLPHNERRHRNKWSVCNGKLECNQSAKAVRTRAWSTWRSASVPLPSIALHWHRGNLCRYMVSQLPRTKQHGQMVQKQLTRVQSVWCFASVHQQSLRQCNF